MSNPKKNFLKAKQLLKVNNRMQLNDIRIIYSVLVHRVSFTEYKHILFLLFMKTFPRLKP